MKRRAPRLSGEKRAQLAWSKGKDGLQDRTRLPGLHWILGSVINSGTSTLDILDKLKELWQKHENIGALRDAFWLCGKLTEPALAMPEWLVDAIDVQLLNPDTSRRWHRYCQDMLDLHRLDLFQIAHAHGISRDEAAGFVVDCEKDAHRVIGAPSVLKLTTIVPARAATNPGRYYIAVSWRPPHAAITKAAVTKGQKALSSRRTDRLFLTRVPGR